jgi:hypothetical protein
VVLGAGCAGSPYGHARLYAPTDDERAALEGTKAYEPTLAERGAGRSGRVSLFGVVQSRSAGPGGRALLRLSVRSLERANLCARQTDVESCRVAVGDRELCTVWALVGLRDDDDVGGHAVGQRSLLRLVGTVGQDVSQADGAPIIHASFYRHFPASEYVTPQTAGARP